MRKTLALVAAGALAVPAGAFAANENGNGGDKPNPSRTCKQLRDTLGKETFNATYGTNRNRSNAFGKCVAKHQKAQNGDQQNASEKCRAEREANPQAFAQQYGTNGNDRNAFGKCVSQNAQEADSQRQQATVSAAKKCKAERKADPAAFAAKYGTNENDRNAFGKCVSQNARQQQQS